MLPRSAQDVLALLHTRRTSPAHLLRAAGGNLWRAMSSTGGTHHRPGRATRFSDDFLWLPYVTNVYVTVTGDRPCWTSRVPFLEAPALAADQSEAFVSALPSGQTAHSYEHCDRALDRG